MPLVEQDMLIVSNSNVMDAISGAEHAHCFGTVM